MNDNPRMAVGRPGWECVDQPLYDRQYMPTWEVAGGLVTGTDKLSFFGTPVGSSGKSYAETNMELPSVLPKACEHLVYDFNVTMPDALDEDKMRLYWSGYFEFIIGAKIYLRLPLLRFALEPYVLKEGARLLIPNSMHFGAQLRWPEAVPLKRGVRINMEIGGYRYRRAE